MRDRIHPVRSLILPAMAVLMMLFFVGCGEQDLDDDPAGYKNVLNIHADALNDFAEGTFEMEDYVTGEYNELQSEYMTYGFLQNLDSAISPAEDYFYGYMDLDGDGNDEFIIMQKMNDDEFIYHGIYSLDNDNEPYMILDTGLWDRCRAFVYSDGTIEVYGSSGAADYTRTFYEFEDGELKLVDEINSDEINSNDEDREEIIPEKFGSMGPPDIEWISFVK